jgi:hypothetical protein
MLAALTIFACWIAGAVALGLLFGLVVNRVCGRG